MKNKLQRLTFVYPGVLVTMSQRAFVTGTMEYFHRDQLAQRNGTKWNIDRRVWRLMNMLSASDIAGFIALKELSRSDPTLREIHIVVWKMQLETDGVLFFFFF